MQMKYWIHNAFRETEQEEGGQIFPPPPPRPNI